MLLGQPYIMFGRTENIAFGITAIHSDVIDLYQEKLVKDGKYYIVDGHEVPVKQTREIIKIRDPFQPSGYRLEELMVNFTHHGPMIHDKYNIAHDALKRVPYKGFGQHDISMSWIGFQNVSEHYSNTRCAISAKSVHEFMD